VNEAGGRRSLSTRPDRYISGMMFPQDT